ncbi:phosphoribosyltransferase, partial [bacterium]|nr:phosphoribosyltransferase [bacterium]
VHSFRSFFPKANLKARTVILTDDGIATGSTVLAALTFLKSQNPKEVILAVPVAPSDSLIPLRQVCDEIVCLAQPRFFRSVGEFYRHFEQVDDDQFIQKLRNWIKQPVAHPK